MNACRMVDQCFEHQNPEFYGRDMVPVEYPIFGGTQAAGEVVPAWANTEGILYPPEITPYPDAEAP